MKTRDWLRGCKLRVSKKQNDGSIWNDGFRYSPADYAKMIEMAKRFKVGDLIFNIYLNKIEKIKSINRNWEPSSRRRPNCRILFIEFITISDYLIYDIGDYENKRLVERMQA